MFIERLASGWAVQRDFSGRVMSNSKDATSAYYAGSSYQQGSNSAVVAQDQAYAERLQQQEFGNAQQVRRVVDWKLQFWRRPVPG